MLGTSLDLPMLAAVLLGALIAGFTTGFAGFGTALVASGLWFHALPAAAVPPLVAMTSVIAQVVGLVTVRNAFDWRRAAPFLLGGTMGVPIGTGALTLASPTLLKASVGTFLILYATHQLLGRRSAAFGAWGGRAADGLVGMGGGFLGGFAGLSGPLPLIWLQLRGGTSDAQRATYQPFNLVILALASLGMALTGQITADILWITLLCCPPTLASAWFGARVYTSVSARTFQRAVLALLLVSGCVLVVDTFAL